VQLVKAAVAADAAVLTTADDSADVCATERAALSAPVNKLLRQPVAVNSTESAARAGQLLEHSNDA